MTDALDPRVERGTRDMLALQRDAVGAGARRLGWKAAFGSPTGMVSLGIDRPLVGFLTHDRLVPPGADVCVQGWARPLLEAEVAVHIGRTLGARPEPAEVAAAIAGLGAAIEVADLDAPPVDVVEILGGNIFHRYVVLGPVQPDRADLTGVTGRVTRAGTEIAGTDDPEALTGRLLDVVGSMADTLARMGAELRAGDVVIAGSVVPPIEVFPGDHVGVELTGLGSIELTFS